MITLLVGLTFPAAPPVPPSVSAGEERMGFWEGVRTLLRRPAFLGLTALWSISAGVNGVSRHDIAGIWVAFFSRHQLYRCRQGWMTLLDVFLEHRESQVQIGWIGFGGSLAGAAGGVLAGILVDRFDSSLKWGLVTLVSAAAVGLG